MLVGVDASRVRMVWRGREGSQESIYRSGLSKRHESQGAERLTHCADGVKPVLMLRAAAEWLLRLVVLFWREKVVWPAGILPRAFSDIPRTCRGTASSIDDDTEGVREWWFEGEDCEGVGWSSCSSSSESSSSPMANVPPSSGTLLSEGTLALCGLLILSRELLRAVLVGLFDGSAPSSISFRL